MSFHFKLIILINLIVLIFNCQSNSSETAKSIDNRLAGWWNITSEFDPSQAIIQSIEGNYKVNKYWEMGYGGSDSLLYSLIRTSEELDTYWDNIKYVKLEKPNVNFEKNLLLIVQPGVGHIKFKYKISIIENQSSIKIHFQSFTWKSIWIISFTISNFAFEIPFQKYQNLFLLILILTIEVMAFNQNKNWSWFLMRLQSINSINFLHS